MSINLTTLQVFNNYWRIRNASATEDGKTVVELSLNHVTIARITSAPDTRRCARYVAELNALRARGRPVYIARWDGDLHFIVAPLIIGNACHQVTLATPRRGEPPKLDLFI